VITPILEGDAWHADVDRARNERDHFHLWWLGQSGFLLQWQGRHVLLDPYLSDSLTQKYAATDKPHVRMTRRVTDPNRLDFIDVVTSSHNHTDHLDAATLLPLMRASPDAKLVIPEANRSFVADRLKIDARIPVGLDDGQSVSVAGFEFTGIASAHEKLDRDARGRCQYLGYVIGFEGGRVYHSGDTVRYDGLAERLRPYQIDVAILPINGADPRRRVAGNLNGREAATLGHAMGARVVIPCHFDMFEFNTASPELFVETAKALGQPVRVLRGGERFTGQP